MMTKFRRTLSNPEFIYLFAVIGIILFGAYLRVWQIGNESLRLDEAQSLWQASHSLAFIRDYMLQNVHLPLHNTLLHFWIRVFGTSESTIRLMSALWGVLLMPVMYFLAKEIFSDRKKAFLALTLSALSPFWIWYSREIRMYTLLTLMSALSYLFYLKVLRKASFINIGIYSLVNLIGIYTHYFFALVLLVQVFYFFIVLKKPWTEQLREEGKKVFGKLTASAAVVIAALAPWLLMLATTQRVGNLAPELERPSSFSIVLSYFQFLFGYQPDYATAALISMWPLGVLVGFVFLEKRRNPITPPLLLAFIGALIPVILIFAISVLYRPVFLTRYLITATPLIVILITWILTELKGGAQKIITGLFVGMVILSLHSQVISDDNPAIENYRGAVEYVSLNVTPRDVVVVSPPYTIYPVQYYYNGVSKVLTMPVWDRSDPIIPELTYERLKQDSTYIQHGHYRIFHITTLDLDGGPEAKEYFDMHYTKLDQKRLSKYIWVEVYQAEYE
jgi:mannosyltransferase